MARGDTEGAEVVVRSSTQTFEQVGRSPWLGESERRAIAEATVVFVPWTGFGAAGSPVFPEGTELLYRFIRDRAPEGTVVELALSDEEYAELSLRDETVSLPQLLATILVAPILVNLVSEWLKRRLGSRLDGAQIRWELHVFDAEHKSTKLVRYEGPAKEFEQQMLRGLEAEQAPSESDNDE